MDTKKILIIVAVILGAVVIFGAVSLMQTEVPLPEEEEGVVPPQEEPAVEDEEEWIMEEDEETMDELEESGEYEEGLDEEESGEYEEGLIN